MGRRKDEEFWQYVEKTGSNGKDLKCKFCGTVFKGHSSISRIKLHFAGIQGQGIRICDKVPFHVKARAHEASGGGNKKRKTVPSSSANEEYNPISKQQNHQVENPVGDEDMMEMEVPEIEQLGEVGMENYEETHVGQPLQFVESKGEELLTTKLKGAEFETHIKQIYSCLRDDDNVSKIGIYGMGGVGKTELAKHIYNKLVTAASPFDHVYWVNVSEHFSIYGLQNTIARMVDLDLSSVDNEHIRAAKLSKALNKNNKSSVLFLDDVWNYIPFDRIGIPGCKLVITTRSLDVCRSMDCQKNIKVEPLGYGADWELFLQKLGHQLVPNVEPIAREIVLECQGLPLGIEIMARNMRRKDDIHQWRDALDKLTTGIPKQENSEIFDNLKRSYDCLNDPSLQQCFLYCALFVQSQIFKASDRREVIDFLIDVGVIERSSRKQAFVEGHTMLNKLENLCLLEGQGHNLSGSKLVSMHRLVRKVAIQIMNTDARVIVGDCKKLYQMPKWGNWPKDLTTISHMYDEIKEIPSGYSPNCPNLSTILLHGNYSLSSIGDSFFELLYGLNVLDLSETSITELPSSISHLVNLSSLLLKCCEELSDVPSLALLSALKKLDLDGSGVKEFPEGIEMLSNLKYLNLRGTEIVLPPGILPKLSQLQVLLLNTSFAVAAKEIASLSMLEELECRFHDIGELKTYAHTTRTPSSYLMRWSFHVGEIDLEDEDELFKDSKLADNFKVCLWNCSISEGDIPLSLLDDVKYLRFINCSVEIENCDDLQRLLSFSSSPSVFKSLEEISIDSNDLLFLFDNGDIPIAVPSSPLHVITFSLLKRIRIWECPSMKKLFPQGLMSNLQNLEDISVCNCDNMEELISMKEGKESYNSNSFSLLKRIEIFECPSMKKLFPQGLMSNLQNLEDISVDSCDNMEELILMEEGKESYNSNSFSLLKKIEIFGCPSMKKLFPQGLMSNLQNLEEIYVRYCDNMEELIAMEERKESYNNNSFSLLKRIEIFGCPSMKKLFPQGLMSILQNLEDISVRNCDNMEELISMEEGKESYNSNSFSLLKRIEIFGCPSMKKLFPQGLMSNLQNLEDISVRNCDNMEELISMEEGKESYNNNSFSLLKRIEIFGCPSMKKLFPQGLMSNLQNLEDISVRNCDNMEELISMEEGKESYNSNSFSLLKRIEIFGCPSIKKLFPQDLMSNLQNLEDISVDSCDNMEELISMEEGKESYNSNSFSLLKRIEIFGCPSMKKLFPQGLMSNLQNLEDIFVDSCDNMEELISMEEGKESYNNNSFSLLKRIEIFGCPSMKKLFPQGLMSNLQNLEDISVRNCDNMEELISMEEGKESYNSNSFSLLKRIEIFGCPSIKKLFPQDLMSNLQNLEDISVDSCDNMEELISMEEGKESYNSNSFSLLKRIRIWGCPSMKKLFPQGLMSNLQNLEDISVRNCDNMEELISMEEGKESYNSNSFSLLKRIEIFGCPSMKKLFPQGLMSNLQNLEDISVDSCDNMEELISMEEGKESYNNNSFSLLKRIEIFGCPSMKKLFPQGLMSNLQNLEEIYVRYCDNMEELIAMEEGKESYNNNSFSLLKRIKIFGCPSMKKLFPQGLMSNLQNLEDISVRNCDNMEELISMEEGKESYNNNSFSLLKRIEIFKCPSMKKLFPQGLMSNFQNLEDIFVDSCDNMEVLISMEEGKESYC